jgi:hypothetical protein
LPMRSRHGYAVDLHRDLPGPTCETVPEVPRPTPVERVRTAHQPRSTGFELARIQEALQHRFLTYTVPSRSPGPTHPAVLDRPDFVAAAPTLPGVSRIRLPPASPTCHDRPAVESSHLHSKQQRLVAHHRPSDTPREFFTRALRAGAVPAEVTTDRAPVYPRVLAELVPHTLHCVEQVREQSS